MPYQLTQLFTSPSDDNTIVYSPHNSFVSTQPTSNLSPSITSTNNSSTLETYPSNTYTSNDKATLNKQMHYNTQFGCRTVLAAKRTTNQSDYEYFKLLYCMYNGCEDPAKSRIT